MNTWLVEGNYRVQAVIILNRRRGSGLDRVLKKTKLYTLDTAGIPVLQQTEVIFPTPELAIGVRLILIDISYGVFSSFSAAN